MCLGDLDLMAFIDSGNSRMKTYFSHFNVAFAPMPKKTVNWFLNPYGAIGVSQLMISPPREDQNSIICLCNGPGFWPNILITFLDRVAGRQKRSSYPQEKKKHCVWKNMTGKSFSFCSFFFYFVFRHYYIQNVFLDEKKCACNAAYILSFIHQSCSWQFKLSIQNLSIIVSLLKNLCELIMPCSPDLKLHFNVQIKLF